MTHEETRVEETLAEQTSWLDALIANHLRQVSDTFFSPRDRLAYEEALFEYREQALAVLEGQLRAAIGRLN